MLSDHCLSCPLCLSVTLVYCGQTVRWIKMKLGMQVGLGPDHIMLDGEPALPPPKGHRPQFSTHVCCGQTAGWIKMSLGMEVGLDPGHILLDGDPAPLKKGGTAALPQIFGPCLLWPNGWMDQDATWYESRPRPRPHCVTWGPSFPPPKERGAAPSIFGPCLLWANGRPSQLLLSTCWRSWSYSRWIYGKRLLHAVLGLMCTAVFSVLWWR